MPGGAVGAEVTQASNNAVERAGGSRAASRLTVGAARRSLRAFAARRLILMAEGSNGPGAVKTSSDWLCRGEANRPA